MNYNDLEIAILRFLSPRIATSFTPERIYEGVKETFEVEEDRFAKTLNLLIEEGLIRGQVSNSLTVHTVEGIAAEGIRVLRRNLNAELV